MDQTPEHTNNFLPNYLGSGQKFQIGYPWLHLYANCLRSGSQLPQGQTSVQRSEVILHEDCQYVNKLQKNVVTQFRQTINICREQMQFIRVFCD